MEFTFDTYYDQKATTAMAKALRKTLRKKRSRITHIIGWVVLILMLPVSLLPGEDGLVIDFRKIITWLALLAILAVLLFEDRINGWTVRKRMLLGQQRTVTVFGEDGYFSSTEIGKTEWTYGNIDLVVEMPAHFVFVFGQNHAQVYDKAKLTGGSAEEFRKFIEAKTNRPVQYIK